MRGMNQVDLAKASGVAQNTISEIELGKREARPATLRKLAWALDVEIADFFEEAGRPKVPTPSSQQLTLNGELEEERCTEWETAVRSARQLREGGRARMGELLWAWRTSKARGATPDVRRGYLDEMGEFLQAAYDAETALFRNLEAGLAAGDREAADRLAAGEKEVPNPGFEEFREASHFYGALRAMVEEAGLHVRRDPEAPTYRSEETERHRVEESEAA